VSRLVNEARDLAESQLADVLPRRWRHVQAVGTKAKLIAPVLDEPDRDPLVAAGWLHDVGYAPALARTGFHPLDGARWLRSVGFDERIAALVAHHSCARLEADERGLAGVLDAEFTRELSATEDALWYVDMTTGPDGQTLDVVDRLAEICIRYGPADVVTRFIIRAERELVSAVRRTEARLADAGVPQPM
jgi:hypothetical protein